jgi:cbb3-type cytochrome c oxidase subunit III
MDGLLMKTLKTQSLIAAALALGFLVARPASAADDFIAVPPDPSTILNARALVSNACSKCHGISGNGISISSIFPILAGQQETYIELALKQLRQRVRPDPHARAFMWGIARGLSDEQIEGVAQYFSSLPAAPSPPIDPALAAKGKEIYESPLQLESGAVNCANCHGLNGQGKSKQAIPRLAGQHPDYMNLQVHYYRNQSRVSAIMNQVSAALTEDQITAVTKYASSLSGARPAVEPAADQN